MGLEIEIENRPSAHGLPEAHLTRHREQERTRGPLWFLQSVVPTGDLRLLHLWAILSF